MHIIIGIDHGYYAIKTAHACFPTGHVAYEYELYTLQNVLRYAGKYYVCGTGRRTLVKYKTANDNYYLLPLYPEHLTGEPSVFMGGGSAIMKRHVTPQDGLCRSVFITDVHANAAGYERIVGQMTEP